MNLPGGDRQSVIDTEHLRLLAIFHFVSAGFAFLGVAMSFLYFAMFQAFFSNPDLWAQSRQPPPPAEMMGFFRWFIIAFGVWFLFCAAGNLLSGIFLRKRRYRTFSVVIAAVNCLHIPIGTVLGVFSLIVLSRESVQSSYERLEHDRVT